MLDMTQIKCRFLDVDTKYPRNINGNIYILFSIFVYIEKINDAIIFGLRIFSLIYRSERNILVTKSCETFHTTCGTQLMFDVAEAPQQNHLSLMI